MTVLAALPHRVLVYREDAGSWSQVGEAVRAFIVQGEKQQDSYSPSQRFASMFTNASVDLQPEDRITVLRGPGERYRVTDLSYAHGATGPHHLEVALEAVT